VTQTQDWQEAFKFALALGLSYMAALSMNWTHPLWAAFSVMTCSLATEGASLGRGILRLAGTLAGCVLGIVLVALVAAVLKGAEVDLEIAKLDLEFTEVRTPVDGYVTHLTVDVGTQAVANKPILALINKNSFWVSAFFR